MTAVWTEEPTGRPMPGEPSTMMEYDVELWRRLKLHAAANGTTLRGIFDRVIRGILDPEEAAAARRDQADDGRLESAKE